LKGEFETIPDQQIKLSAPKESLETSVKFFSE